MKVFDPAEFRLAFPAIKEASVYLDSASTALKPQAMIDATQQYYTEHTATAYRSAHSHAQQVTAQLEAARVLVAKRLGATQKEQIIWTKGATESINLVAQSYARPLLKPNDEIIVSELEHHSNLIPWLIVAEQTGAKVIKWPINNNGQLDLNTLRDLLNDSTKIVAVSQMSNVTGYQPDLAKITDLTHQHQAVIVVDGAQGVVHTSLDVTALDIDFYAFSAHKLYGPTGLGVLYAKSQLLADMPAWQGGGKMLKTASFAGFTPQDSPERFEAGTPNIAAILGFYATLSWLDTLDQKSAEDYTQQLMRLAQAKLQSIAGFTYYNKPNSPLLSFNIQGIHHSDLAILLAEQNIAIRTGGLCAQPLMQALDCDGVIRASFAPYNNHNEVEKFVESIHNALTILI